MVEKKITNTRGTSAENQGTGSRMENRGKRKRTPFHRTGPTRIGLYGRDRLRAKGGGNSRSEQSSSGHSHQLQTYISPVLDPLSRRRDFGRRADGSEN